MISARQFYEEGRFGEIFYCESQHDHPGLEALYFEDGKRTWRHGMAPVHYPTHNTAHLIGLTGERLVEVKCHGWGDDDPICKDNVYKKPFWNEMAMFFTGRGRAFRVRASWRGALRGGETGPLVRHQDERRDAEDPAVRPAPGVDVRLEVPVLPEWSGEAGRSVDTLR